MESPKYDQPLQVSSDDEAEVQTKTKDTLILQPPPSPKSIKIQEIKVLADMKGIPDKLDKFQTSILVLTTKVASLEGFKLEIPAECHFLSILKASDTSVPSTGQVDPRHVEGEKNTNQQPTITQLFQRKQTKYDVVTNMINKPITKPIITEPTTTSISQTITTTAIIIPTTTTPFQSPFITSPIKTTHQSKGEQIREKGKKVMSHDEVDEEESGSTSNAESRPFGTLEDSSKSKPLKKSEKKKGKKFLIKTLGQDVVAKAHKDKVKYDKYHLKMLNRRVQGKITNYDMLTRGKGLINPKVYNDDDSSEIIYNFKTSDLHVGEWKGMMDACPKRTGVGWSIIYTQIRKKLDDIHKTKQELELYKTSVQYGDLLAGTMLNDPALGMILFNAQHGQDFISIEHFAKLNNDMLYHVQENFFRLHQEPGMDDLARTLSSLLVAEVDKRNLNPNKQMRLIEKLRQLLNVNFFMYHLL
ncbi:hypothetical protein Tco_0216315 [Tanacetum coccineum]